MTARRIVVVLAVLGGAVSLGLGWLLAGTAGVVVVATAVAVLAVLLTGLTLPAVRVTPHSGQPRLEGGEEFPDYKKIAAALGWAQSSARHFDYATRPVLFRITVSVLAAQRGIDAERDPATARRLLGDPLWELIDPGRPAREDNRAQPPSPAQLAALTKRLEEL